MAGQVPALLARLEYAGVSHQHVVLKERARMQGIGAGMPFGEDSETLSMIAIPIYNGRYANPRETIGKVLDVMQEFGMTPDQAEAVRHAIKNQSALVEPERVPHAAQQRHY